MENNQIECLPLVICIEPNQIKRLEIINEKYKYFRLMFMNEENEPDIRFQEKSDKELQPNLNLDLNSFQTTHHINTVQTQQSQQNHKNRLRRYINHKKQTPFKQAKQISIQTNYQLWGCTIFPSHNKIQMFKKLTYISTCSVQTVQHKFKITTFLTADKLVLFRIQISNIQATNIKQIWSFLSIYHHVMPNLDIYSLMYRWTQYQIYAFWLVRSIAIQAMLFRLKVHSMQPEYIPRFRYWHIFDSLELKQKNQSIINEFAESGNWISSKPKFDFRMAAHNEVNWGYQGFDWNLDGHHILQIRTKKLNNYKNNQLKEWFLIVKKLYLKFIDCHRIQLNTYPHNGCRNRDSIIFTNNGAHFNFNGSIQLWKEQSVQDEYTPFTNLSQLNNATQCGYWSEEQDEQDMNEWMKELDEEGDKFNKQLLKNKRQETANTNL